MKTSFIELSFEDCTILISVLELRLQYLRDRIYSSISQGEVVSDFWKEYNAAHALFCSVSAICERLADENV